MVCNAYTLSFDNIFTVTSPNINTISDLCEANESYDVRMFSACDFQVSPETFNFKCFLFAVIEHMKRKMTCQLNN